MNQTGNTAIGYNSNAYSDMTTAVGGNAFATGYYSTAIGFGAYAAGNNTHAVGFQANNKVDNSFVLGNNRITTLRCAVQTITSLSDERTKKNIEIADIARCLEDVMRLPVKRFEFEKWARPNVQDIHQTGFIAQDVEKVFPKNVLTSEEKFAEIDENGKQLMYEDGTPKYKIIEDCKEISSDTMLATLWAAVQCLAKKVETLSELIKDNQSE